MPPTAPIARSASNVSTASSSDQQPQQRSKHIEVCVRLRPLRIQRETSSSSFFYSKNNSNNNKAAATAAPRPSSGIRKPGLPRPNASSRIPGAVRKAVERLDSRQHRHHQQNNVDANGDAFYAWDVVDADTVTQSPRTEIVQGRTHTYTLDSVYSPHATTAEVYQQSVQDLVHAAMDGYHTAVLAYGQTSTGKTHTMTGTTQEPGIIPLAVQECFQCIAQQNRSREYLLRVSYLEVYKEHIRDLLAPTTNNTSPTPVRLFEQRGGKLQIKGLREEVVTSPAQVFQVLAQGEARRQVGATHLNQHSSRSHVMVRLWIESRTTNTNGSSSKGESVRASTLSLVDLAGSESVRLTGSTDRQSEGHYINQSLMTLGQVVYALSEQDSTTTSNKRGGGSGQHIPYRDSKLTRILQPSLSGNAQVVLLCCISPLPSHIEESHNTFKFATRAKKIPQKAVIQNVGELDDKTLLQAYREEIEDLRQQLREAEAQRQALLELQQQKQQPASDRTDDSDPTFLHETAEDAEEEMLELMDAIQKMERLILKTGNEDVGGGRENETDKTTSMAEKSIHGEADTASTAPSTPENRSQHHGRASSSSKHRRNGSNRSPNTTSSPRKDDLQQELHRIQGLLGSVLKKRAGRTVPHANAGSNGYNNINSTPTKATATTASEEELRLLRAQLEEQEVATSLRQADSSFLQAQLEEKDNLLVEVSKILEAVEDRQAALEAENKALRSEVDRLRLGKGKRLQI